MAFLRRTLTASHLVSVGVTDVAIVVLATVSGILVARLLGPEGRGQFAIIILWPSLLAAVGNLGVREALTYEQASVGGQQATLTGHAILLGLIQSAGLMALGLILIPILTRRQDALVTQASLVFLLVIPANLLAIYTLGLLQGALDMRAFNLIRLSVNFVYVVGILILWYVGQVTVWNVTIALLVANMITATLATTAALIRYGVRWRLDLVLTRRLFSYGLRNHIGSLSFLLNQRLDQMVMALVLSPIQLGWYAAAANISGMARLASGAFGTVVFPKTTLTAPEDRRRLTSVYSRLNVTVTGASGLLLIIVMPLIVPLIYGSDYQPSIVPAIILTVGAVFVGIGQSWAGSLRGLGHPLGPTKAELISLGVTVIGLALTLKPWGIIGASLTSTVAYFVSASYLYLQLRRLLAVNLREVLLPVLPQTLRVR